MANNFIKKYLNRFFSFFSRRKGLPEKGNTWQEEMVKYEGRTTNNEFFDAVYGDEISYLPEKLYDEFLRCIESPLLYGKFFDLSPGKEKISEGFMRKLFDSEKLFGLLMKKIESTQADAIASLDDGERRICNDDVKISVVKRLGNDGLGLSSFHFNTVRQAAEEALQLQGDEFPQEIKENMKKFINTISIENLRSQVQGDYHLSIDGKEFSIPKQELITMLAENEKDFESRFHNKDNMDAKRLAYALKTFVYSIGKKDYHYDTPTLLDVYDFPEISKERFERLCNYKYINFKGVNLAPSTKGIFNDEFTLNDELRTAVYDGMPADFSNLEKSIYIYGRLCQLLSYDSDFCASDERGEAKKRHIDVKNLGEITPENNIVICYEFANIYSKFLEEQNINNKLISRSGEDITNYSGMHSLNLIKVEDIAFTADSTDGIFRGDLINAKLGAGLTGLMLGYEFKSTENQQKFFDALGRVSKVLSTKVKQPKISDLIAGYTELASIKTNAQVKTQDQKKNIFDMYKSLLQDTSVEVKGMERMTYLLDLTKALYGESSDEKVELLVLYRGEEDKRALTSIIVYRDKASHSKKETFFEYTPLGALSKLDPADLAKDIKDGRLGVLRKDRGEKIERRLKQIAYDYSPKDKVDRDEV